MIILSFSNTVVLLSLPLVQGIRKCQKIDACRCTTDEGEINLWSLASRKPNQPSFSFEGARVGNTSHQTEDLYEWDPCIPWTATRRQNETTENKCKDVAVCLTRKTKVFGTFRVDIGQQNLSDCMLDSGRCVLTYGVTGDNQTKTQITLVCNETDDIGRVDPMEISPSLYHTSLYSECACPGRCSGLSTLAIVCIVVGSVAGFLLLLVAVYVCCLRRRLNKLQDGHQPKPSMCAKIKDDLTALCCQCCRKSQYQEL